MSTSADRLSRLLALVPWLLVNDGIEVSAAAQHFGISESQLESDLNLLICCGLPGYSHAELVDIQFWDDGRIHVLDPQTLSKPLRLSGEEATALLVALRLLAQIPGDHDTDALLSTTLRLQEAVGGVALDGVVVDPGVDARVAAHIDRALSGDADLRLEYGAASDTVTERVVTPIRTLTHDGRTYLEAHCHLAGAQRTFRLDRILSAEVTDRDPNPAVAPNPEAEATASVMATVQVDAVWVAEALGAVVAPHAATPLTVEIPVYDEQWIVHAVLGLGGAATVVAPETLRAAVAAAAAEALASYA